MKGTLMSRCRMLCECRKSRPRLICSTMLQINYSGKVYRWSIFCYRAWLRSTSWASSRTRLNEKLLTTGFRWTNHRKLRWGKEYWGDWWQKGGVLLKGHWFFIWGSFWRVEFFSWQRGHRRWDGALDRLLRTCRCLVFLMFNSPQGAFRALL